ncbi:ATP-binding cassette domain-containing protein [Mangrovicoccus ximenensis]|uniref:ATP-binding cassette domain-containing protein n=1 Tax=Mangrovicoccus ximenensis TaxID=1911570 RepID=UPI000D3A9B83|nr:ATP-binding cassette domain-containing protein [Mangrovicoccus ximenensis]
MIEISDLTVRFSGVTAIDALSVAFTRPVNGIIGPNGAGKTTTMNAISGFVACSGSLRHDGEEIGRLPPYRRTRWGLRRSFQREQIAGDLSIAENLQAILDGLPMSRAEKRRALAEALEATGLRAARPGQSRRGRRARSGAARRSSRGIRRARPAPCAAVPRSRRRRGCRAARLPVPEAR